MRAAPPAEPGRNPVRQSVELRAGVTRELLPLTAQDGEPLDGALYRRPDAPMRVAVVLMHPSASFLHHYAAIPLAARGFTVLAMNSRFAGGDAGLLMEAAALDLAAGVAQARERGAERVALLGSGGGGALAAFYQAQAEAPTITATPGGLPPDLTAARLPRADALVLVNAHRGRSRVLTDRLDPAVTDERDPLAGDAELDLFARGRRPPYDAAFVERYRAAQVARNARITAWVRERLVALRRAGIADEAFTVHRTAVDPRLVDPAIDPSDREHDRGAAARVRAMNAASTGLARHTTLHSWLSQWSLEAGNAAAEPNLARVAAPLLSIQGTADEDVFPSDARALFAAGRMDDKRLCSIPGGTHHFLDQPAHLGLVLDLVEDWLAERGMGPRR